MIDQLQVNFSESALTIMNIVIGFIMFGVALDLQFSDFKRTFKNPKPVLIGMTAQYLLLPAFTFLLVLIVQPIPSIALGLFLVAACPGGNLSNFLTYFAKGNTPLSISMSAISTTGAIIMTPLNTLIWAALYEPTRNLMRDFSISPMDMFITIFIMLGLPIVLGMTVRAKYELFAVKLNKFMKTFSILIFLAFVTMMLINNWSVFTEHLGSVLWIVIVLNACAITIGYFAARIFKTSEADRRAIAIEIGIQNSGLGLVLIFNFFGGLGGMAMVAAWWGIWHIISGLIVASFWSKREIVPEIYVSSKLKSE